MQLVIDTATDACSVALVEGGETVAERHEVIGRGHAEKLLPMIAALPGGGRADAILVDCGPGSFTGVRVGLAAARALALAWQAQLHGYSSLALLAAAGLAARPESDRITATIHAGHGEVFVQRFSSAPFAASGPFASLRPGEAADAIAGGLIVGNAAEEMLAHGASGDAMTLLPRAAGAAGLPEEMRRLAPEPLYGRAPDARPMA